MQNKIFSLAMVLLASVALGGLPVNAQTTSKTNPPAVATQKAKTAPVQAKPLSGKKTDNQAKKQTAQKPVQKQISKPKTENKVPATKTEAANTKKPAALSPDKVLAENKRRLEEELKNTTISGKSIVDFPNRSSLGSLELAPIPGINETSVRGPLPMAASVSGKDLPSEQLLGRITPEVFQEMADLERGNTFLKLELEKERLKNDLEKLKATYRQQRLEEISKRENVVRSRIQWWQEQERLRLAIEKKQAEEEALNRKIAEQEAARDRIREETLRRASAAAKAPGKPEEEDKKVPEKKPIIISQPTMEELYTLDSIRGIGQKLTAKIKSRNDGSVLVVKKDDILPSGHVVKEVSRDKITVAFGNRIDQLIIRSSQK